jgi:hypothetical protein
MIHINLFIFLVFAFVVPVAGAAVPSEQLLSAIARVESDCNPSAIGDAGKAIGIYQIHRAYWQDAVDHDPSIGGEYKDCFNPEYARRIVIAYMNRYAPANASDETFARIHNGGPSGHKKSATLKYWSKVKKKMN